MSACPKCGHQNIQSAKFCQSCGTALALQTPSQPFTPAPAPYYTLPPRRGLRSEEKVIIIVVVLVVILVVGAVASVFIFYNPSRLINRVTPRPAPVTVTGFILHIQYPNSVSSGYFGSATRILNNSFLIYLKHSEQFQGSFMLTLSPNSAPHSVDSISFASTPRFTLLFVGPSPPLTIQPGFSVRFTVMCQAPNSDYTGPAILDLVTT